LGDSVGANSPTNLFRYKNLNLVAAIPAIEPIAPQATAFSGARGMSNLPIRATTAAKNLLHGSNYRFSWMKRELR
jgi:hypothetical protein